MDILCIAFLWVVYASLTASILALLVLLIKKLLHVRLTARLHHILWIPVLLRLLVPVAPESPFSLFNLWPAKALGISASKNVLPGILPYTYDFFRLQRLYQGDIEATSYLDGTKIGTPAQSPASGSLTPKGMGTVMEQKKENLQLVILKIASRGWLAGVCCMILFTLLSMISFQRKTRYFRELSDPEMQNVINICKKKANIKKNIPVYITQHFGSPCISGIVSPRIYLPEGITHITDPRSLEHIILHELGHFRRKDLLLNLLGALAVMVHWFNPVSWLAVRSMKLDRELACDAYVLEVLGEEEAVPYGFTMINFSKFFISRHKQLNPACFYETKNQLERRIEMINIFKKGSYKISAAVVACCIVISAVTLTNAVSPKNTGTENTVTAAETNTLEAVPTDAPAKEEKGKFLIDAPVKVYRDIKKIEKVAGFKFKVPDFVPAGYRAGFRLVKASERANVLEILFDKQSGKQWSSFRFEASSENLLEFLPRNSQNQSSNRSVTENTVESSVEVSSIAGINGSTLTIKSTLKRSEHGLDITSKYFVWQNDGIWYGIKYEELVKSASGKTSKSSDLSREDMEKIILSIKFPWEVSNSNYAVSPPDLSTEVVQLPIFDEMDFKEAKALLGFTPKFPLELPGAIKASFAGVGISSDSDISAKRIRYELNMLYDFENGAVISFQQGNSLQIYEELSKKGYHEYQDAETNKAKQVKAETLKIDGKDVFKYEYQYSPDSAKSTDYVWKENGFCCSVAFFGKIADQEEILHQMVSEKPKE